MSKIVNLKRFRKQKERTDKDRLAEENRIRFGRTRSQKQSDTQSANDLVSHLDGHKRDKKD